MTSFLLGDGRLVVRLSKEEQRRVYGIRTVQRVAALPGETCTEQGCASSGRGWTPQQGGAQGDDRLKEETELKTKGGWSGKHTGMALIGWRQQLLEPDTQRRKPSPFSHLEETWAELPYPPVPPLA